MAFFLLYICRYRKSYIYLQCNYNLNKNNMTNSEIKEVLRLHSLWLDGETHGERANLECANLKGAYLERANLECANLKGAYLKGANLECADLKGAYLKGADLKGANLEGAYLERANLECANLEGANLKGAYLKGANLKGADLKGANLEGANLKGAYLEGADLEFSRNYYSFTAFDTSKRIVHCVKWEKKWMVKAGCFWGTLEELETKVINSHKSEIYLKNIDILKTI